MMRLRCPKRIRVLSNPEVSHHLTTSALIKNRPEGLLFINGGREGFEPSIQYDPYDDLANRCLQPLGHRSMPKQGYQLPVIGQQINHLSRFLRQIFS
jgi:hypothetical protein